MASFSVATIAKEDEAIIRYFCEFFVKLGAERILLYYDGTVDHIDKSGVLADGGIVDIVACDSALWRGLNIERPSLMRNRQGPLYKVAYEACTSDWLLACDLDEFIIMDQAFGAWLDSVPEDVESVTFPSVEAVWQNGEDIDTAFETTLFRLPFSDLTDWRQCRAYLYGPISRVMKDGLASHAHGKSVTRAGIDDIAICAHEAQRNGMNISLPASEFFDHRSAAYLAHFDAISFRRWKTKFAMRAPSQDNAGAGSKKRRQQTWLANFAARFGNFGSKCMFRALYCLSPRQIKLLDRRKLLVRRDLSGTLE